MRGAHSRVLANRDWGELSLESLTDTSAQVATAFARYPYPESFFSWQQNNDHGVVFFNRANRFPAWMPRPTEAYRYPGCAGHKSAGRRSAARPRPSVRAARLSLRGVRHDARRRAVPDRREARLRGSLAGAAAFGDRIHGEPGLGSQVLLLRHPLAGRADRHARQHPRHRRARRQRKAGLGPREQSRGDGARVPAAVRRSIGEHGRARLDCWGPQLDDSDESIRRLRADRRGAGSR